MAEGSAATQTDCPSGGEHSASCGDGRVRACIQQRPRERMSRTPESAAGRRSAGGGHERHQASSPAAAARAGRHDVTEQAWGGAATAEQPSQAESHRRGGGQTRSSRTSPLPRDRVVVRCDDGWVTLTGEVERAYQRSSAEADVLRVRRRARRHQRDHRRRRRAAQSGPGAWTAEDVEPA